MKQPHIYSIFVAILIALVNWWLAHALSDWKISIGGEQRQDIWTTLITGLAALAQIPALIMSKWITDTLGLSTTGWAAVTSAVSILIYSPLVYVLSGRWIKLAP